ncbi:hypothetical protein GLOIN_2v1789599 [Rhizophagus clarus]|uniref:Uncharacterized protein n=1 Tax=Rhizophagus clarus TaxID=94130 RepID=A0A8H3QPQ2_9GLOM|nr:hypothetical protein GLOIN_2v1789599 [Rhizophagus clarus]
MENQKGSSEVENLLSVENLSIMDEEVDLNNILCEEPDFSAVMAGDVSIPDNGLCTYCKKPILSDNPPRSVVINVYGHIHHQICADKRGVLSCEKEGGKSVNRKLPEVQRRKLSFVSSVFTLDELSINAPSKALNMQDVSDQLHKMYYDIDVAEKKRDQVKRCSFELFSIWKSSI